MPSLPAPSVKKPSARNVVLRSSSMSSFTLKASNATLAGALAIASDEGAIPAIKGEPGIGAKAPVEPSIVYADMLFEPMFATYANLPAGSIAIEFGYAPVAYGPMTGSTEE